MNPKGRKKSYLTNKKMQGTHHVLFAHLTPGNWNTLKKKRKQLSFNSLPLMPQLQKPTTLGPKNWSSEIKTRSWHILSLLQHFGLYRITPQPMVVGQKLGYLLKGTARIGHIGVDNSLEIQRIFSHSLNVVQKYGIVWIYPTPHHQDASHHQDDIIFLEQGIHINLHLPLSGWGGLDPRYCQFSPNGQPSYQHNMITIWVASGFDKHPIIISKKCGFQVQNSTRPIFIERSHSKLCLLENSQGRSPSETFPPFATGKPTTTSSFLGREKQIPGDDPAATFWSPILGGHEHSPLISGHVFTHSPSPKKGHKLAELPSWRLRNLYFF